MNTPFTKAQFLDVFRSYNEDVYPLQVVIFLLALLVVFLSIMNKPKSGVIISIILTCFWLWMGIAYHGVFFSSINKLAYVFGTVFIIQAVLFFIFGVLKQKLSFQFRPDIYGTTGLLFIVFALFLYPLIGTLGNHAYPYAPTFGLPCPTTIFTFGIILLSNNKFPLILIIIPFLWSLLGLSAAINFGITEDWFLIIAGLTTLLLTLIRNRKLSQHSGLLSAEI